MNDHPTNDPEHEENRAAENEAENDASTQSDSAQARESYEDLGKAVRNAWKAGTDDARKAARDAMPKAKEEFSRGLRDLAWGVSYLTSFGTTLLREFTPESVEEGWEKGAEAGKKAAETFAERRREKSETDGPEEEPPVDSENRPMPA